MVIDLGADFVVATACRDREFVCDLCPTLRNIEKANAAASKAGPRFAEVAGRTISKYCRGLVRVLAELSVMQSETLQATSL